MTSYGSLSSELDDDSIPFSFQAGFCCKAQIHLSCAQEKIKQQDLLIKQLKLQIHALEDKLAGRDDDPNLDTEENTSKSTDTTADQHSVVTTPELEQEREIIETTTSSTTTIADNITPRRDSEATQSEEHHHHLESEDEEGEGKKEQKCKLKDNFNDPEPETPRRKAAKKAVMATVKAPLKAGKAVWKGSHKAVVGTGRVVGHIGEQVVKTSTHAVVGTGKAVVGVTVGTGKALARSLRKNSLRSIDPSSQWDQAICIIDDLLVEGSSTYDIMTDSQRSQLNNVRMLLLEGVQGQMEDKLAHIPIKLIQQNSKRSLDSSNYDRSSIQYIMGEFGGVSMKDNNAQHRGLLDDSIATESSFEESLLGLHSFEFEGSGCDHHEGFDIFARSRRSSTISGDGRFKYYIPPEFENLSKDAQRSLYHLLSWSSLEKWDFNIFNLADMSDGHPLVMMGWAVIGSPHAQYTMAKYCGMEVPSYNDIRGYDFMGAKINISLKKLCDYLRVIEDDYRSENPYHNEIHAADVLQSLHSLIQMAKKSSSFEIKSNEELFSVLLAAAVHDVRHPGYNNSYQVNLKTELALTYNDVSVLENYHASHAFMTMLSIPRHNTRSKSQGSLGRTESGSHHNNNHHHNNVDLNLLSNTTMEQQKLIRSKMIECIMQTDMKTHFQAVNALKGLLMKQKSDPYGDDNKNFVWKVFIYMLHMADLSGQARPGWLSSEWGNRVMEEFFLQGDRERELGLPISPNCNRHTTKKYDSQLDFINFVILPAYAVLGEVIPDVKTHILPIIDENLSNWAQEKASAEGKALDDVTTEYFDIDSESEFCAESVC